VLDALVPPDGQLVVEGDDGRLVATGEAFHTADVEDAFTTRLDSAAGQVSLRYSSDDADDALGRNLGSLIVLVALLSLVAGLVGLVAASRLSRPFQQLAEAAAALGRGRFDLDLPRSRIPEVTAINTALVTSAAQLKHSIRRDREFLQHASHVLRTPIAGCRLELEELAGRPGLDEDARSSVLHSAKEMERLNGVVDELITQSRNRPLVAGAEVDLQMLATDVGNRWREDLREETRVRVFVDDGAADRVTPGPVEQLLEHVLSDVQALDPREVSLRFAGQGNYLRIRVHGAESGADHGDETALERALSVTEAMGGRMNGDVMAERGLEILLPRR
jgi:signal transduction histidine kinase